MAIVIDAKDRAKIDIKEANMMLVCTLFFTRTIKASRKFIYIFLYEVEYNSHKVVKIQIYILFTLYYE